MRVVSAVSDQTAMQHRLRKLLDIVQEFLKSWSLSVGMGVLLLHRPDEIHSPLSVFKEVAATSYRYYTLE